MIIKGLTVLQSSIILPSNLTQNTISFYFKLVPSNGGDTRKRVTMKLLRQMLVLSLVLVMAAPVFAGGWFDFSDEEYAACNQKYFGAAAGSLEDYLALDLSTIENKTDAKMLAKKLTPMIEPIKLEQDALVVRCEELQITVKHFFNVLYTKEVHDELWESTRPLKQSAYKKELTEFNESYKRVRSLGTTLFQAEAIEDALKAISRQFKVEEL